MPIRALGKQIAFRYRSIDSATGVTRETAKKLAERLGVDETQAIHHALHELDFESKKAQAKQMLQNLGFKPEQLDASVSALSVGWKMRVVLAKLLLQKADFYLFDAT